MEGECPRHDILCQTVQNKTAASNNYISIRVTTYYYIAVDDVVMLFINRIFSEIQREHHESYTKMCFRILKLTKK